MTTKLTAAISTAHTEAEMLDLLKDPAFAIAYALRYPQSWEVSMFLEDWQKGASMADWLDEWREEKATAEGNAIRVRDIEAGIPSSADLA